MDYRDKRLRTSAHLRCGADSIVFDTGPDFRQQMLRERIQKLDAVVFTHAHKDHTAGLDDVRSYNFLQQADMPVYGRPEVHDQLRQEFAYAFSEHQYPGIPRIALREIDDHSFMVGNTELLPLPVTHLKLPVLGFRVGNLAYITDANHIPESTFGRLKGLEVLVLNALQIEPHVSHFNLDQALEVARRVGAQRTWFTHISHRLGLHAEVEARLPADVRLAWDGLKITC